MRAKGRNLITLVGEQSDKDTEATSYLKLLAKSNTLEPKYEKIKSEALDGNAFVKKGAVVGVAVSGNTDVELTKDQLVALIPFAGFVETGVDTSIYKLASSITKYATIISQMTDAGEERKFTGCKINNLGIDMALKSYVALNCEWMGLDYNYATVLSSPTAVEITEPRIKTVNPNILVKIDGVDKTAQIKSLNFTLANNISVDEVLGQIVAEDLDAESIEPKISITAIFDKVLHQEILTKLKSETDFPMEFLLDTSFKIKLPNVEVETVSAPVSNGDKIELTFEVVAKYDKVEETAVVIDLFTV